MPGKAKSVVFMASSLLVSQVLPAGIAIELVTERIDLHLQDKAVEKRLSQIVMQHPRGFAVLMRRLIIPRQSTHNLLEASFLLRDIEVRHAQF